MPQQTFTVSSSARVQVRACEDRVTITGWDDDHRVAVDGSARQEGDTIVVENAAKVTLRVPRAATILITDCQADVRLDDLNGPIELDDIEGDLALRSLGGAVLVRHLKGDLVARGVAALKGEGTWEGDAAVRGTEQLQVQEIEGEVSLNDLGTVAIEEVGGDLSVRGVRGACHLGGVKGDVSLREVEGDLRIEHADGDVIASDVKGNVNAEEIEGDAVLSLAGVKNIVLRAEGDVVLNIPADASADIELDAPHGDVVARGLTSVVEQDENHLRGSLGTGSAHVQVESLHDDVILRVGDAPGSHHEHGSGFREPFMGMGEDFAEMGRRIAEETRQSVEESLAGFGIHHHGGHHPRHRMRHSEQVAERPEPPEENKPRGPEAGSAERQAILDAVARGELSVDDAIRKIRGEA